MNIDWWVGEKYNRNVFLNGDSGANSVAEVTQLGGTRFRGI